MSVHAEQLVTTTDSNDVNEEKKMHTSSMNKEWMELLNEINFRNNEIESQSKQPDIVMGESKDIHPPDTANTSQSTFGVSVTDPSLQPGLHSGHGNPFAMLIAHPKIGYSHPSGIL